MYARISNSTKTICSESRIGYHVARNLPTALPQYLLQKHAVDLGISGVKCEDCNSERGLTATPTIIQTTHGVDYLCA